MHRNMKYYLRGVGLFAWGYVNCWIDTHTTPEKLHWYWVISIVGLLGSPLWGMDGARRG